MPWSIAASSEKPCELVIPMAEYSIPNAMITSAAQRIAEERIM